VAAAALGDRKIEQLRTVNADIVATSNAGCLLQIQAAGRRATHDLPVLHPIQLLDAAIRGLSVNELLH
jgi:glycolate oxidase iron-sulfur subunit